MRAGSAQVAWVRIGIRRAFTTAAAVMIGGGTSALAAQSSMQLTGDTSLMDGAKLGILVLLAITLAMQGAFVAFFLYLRRRAKRIADVDLDVEWSEVQSSPRRS